MKGDTHELLGVCAAFGVSRALELGPLETGGLIGAAYASSRWPDRMEGGILPHRGPTHQILMPFVVAAALGAAVWALIVYGLPAVPSNLPDLSRYALTAAAVAGGGVAVGYGAHLLADMCTRSGLEVGQRRVHLLPRPLRVRTGATSERIFQLLVLLSIGAYIYVAWWPSD